MTDMFPAQKTPAWKKIPATTGSIILLLGGAFHLTGLPLVMREASSIENGFLRALIEPLWLFPAIHWAVFAILALSVTIKPSHHTRFVLFVVAATVIADAALTAMKLGPFIGALMLGLAGGLILIGAIIMPYPRRA